MVITKFLLQVPDRVHYLPGLEASLKPTERVIIKPGSYASISPGGPGRTVMPIADGYRNFAVNADWQFLRMFYQCGEACLAAHSSTPL